MKNCLGEREIERERGERERGDRQRQENSTYMLTPYPLDFAFIDNHFISQE